MLYNFVDITSVYLHKTEILLAISSHRIPLFVSNYLSIFFPRMTFRKFLCFVLCRYSRKLFLVRIRTLESFFGADFMNEKERRDFDESFSRHAT